ncbi:hypothetical protein [Streptomyces mirabilis]|uniref:hypothetical protein n=1 Tax=Streptomyces mirabilis TaxID=68239 RepID=UPI0033B4634B
MHLRLEGPSGGPDGGPDELIVDHVLAATGYRLDVDALDFLAPVRRAVAGRPARRRYACPGAFESSLPGLYFTGSLAAPDFAPMLRSLPAPSSPPDASRPLCHAGHRDEHRHTGHRGQRL